MITVKMATDVNEKKRMKIKNEARFDQLSILETRPTETLVENSQS